MPDEFLNRKPQYERFHRAGQFIETEEKLFAVYSNGKIEVRIGNNMFYVEEDEKIDNIRCDSKA